MSRLIVTNGKSGVESIQQAGIEGDVFSWDDVLHDGPVPGGYRIEVLSELRARYIASVGWGAFEDVHERFKARDNKLAGASSYQELILFFEHDLYDQLQLIQLLDLFSNEIKRPPKVSLVYPPTFIAHCTGDELCASFEDRNEASAACLAAATESWRAFTAESPETLGVEIGKEEPALPHLYSSLMRLAEEYPNYLTELSRTEGQILLALEEGNARTGELFKYFQASEPATFMGDSSFMMYLKGLCLGGNPLVTPILNGSDQVLAEVLDYTQMIHTSFEITGAGKAVLHGEARKSDFLEIDRWIGGTHVTAASLWCWNPEELRFQL